MPYRVEFAPPALKEFKDLSAYIRAQAIDLLERVAQEPRSKRAKELRDKPNIWRIWLAKDWRVIYVIEEEEQRVRVLRIRPKEQIDYESV